MIPGLREGIAIMAVNKKKRSLKWNMIVMLSVGWLLPLALTVFAMFYYISNNMERHLRENISVSEEKAVEICEMNFSNAMGASRNASYMNVIRDAYLDNKQSKENSEQQKKQLYNTVTGFLNDQYRYNTSFLTTMVYFNTDPDQVYYTYSNMKSGTFDRIRYFETNVKEEVQNAAAGLDTGILFLNVKGNLYMVRNMMTSTFHPFAVIVMELDPAAMFKSFESIMGFQRYEVYLDGKLIAGSGTGRQVSAEYGRIYRFGRKNSYLYDRIPLEGHDMEIKILLDTRSAMDEYNFTDVIVFFLLSMIPLIILVLWFFHREFTKPVTKLMHAAEEIEHGSLGISISQTGNSREFQYLGESFNHMSFELKRQFDTIYSEELALRDAKIKALQSQINPHFLNNTLEIINWEARMSGNEKAGGMLEATMDRRKLPYLPLAEELKYMDAYLYIVKCRFEDKLCIYRDIDDTLLQIKVPRLIIQPIVENAVEHGVDEDNQVIIYITIKLRDKDTMVIEVKNHGLLSPEDEKKICLLLSGETNKDEHSVNIGIRNVNQRLKMIYGPKCGLEIKAKEGYTVSTLTLLVNKHNKNQ